MKLWRKLFLEEWGKFITFTIVMVMISVLQTFFWPTIEKLVPALVENLPEPVKWIAGGMAENGFIFFTITQHFLKNLGLFGGFFGIMLGASAMAKELENNTMELLLAQPVSRLRVLTEKYVFGATMLGVPIILSSIAIAPSAWIVLDEKISIINLLLSGFYGFAITLVFYSFTFCLGIFLGEQMKTISISLILLIFQFSLNILDQTRAFTILGWFDESHVLPIITLGKIPMMEISVFFLISGVIFAVSYWQFRRMNI